MEKVEAADRIEPQAQGNVVENFKAKTNELFHEISEMNPAELVDNVLNNGAGEKAQKEENKKEQERPAGTVGSQRHDFEIREYGSGGELYADIGRKNKYISKNL